MTDVPPHDAPDRDASGRPLPPPPAPSTGMASPSAPDPDTSRTRAIWAVVLAIVPLCLTWIVAAVLAIMVLVGPRDGQKRGRGMAWSALGVVAAWGVASVVVATVLLVTASDERDTDRDDNRTDDRAGSREDDRDHSSENGSDDDSDSGSDTKVFVSDLAVGDCIDEDVEDLFGEGLAPLTLTVRPCDESHIGEVYHETDLGSGSYPGDEQVFTAAEQSCLEQFEPWVGQTYERSALDFTYFSPSEDSWAYGDRLISCIVVSPDEVTGTLEGSGR